jgi:alkylresorcinol/alkylpyrone synthase
VQKTLLADIANPRKQSGLGVEILSVATANPKYRIGQDEVSLRANTLYPHFARLESLYTNTGIENRYACEPPDWYHHPRGWEERTTSFRRHALDLIEEVTLKAVAQAGIETRDIGMIVVNTITGLAVPSLDAMLLNRLPFSPNVERLPIFGLGCGGGVAGMARAARLAHSLPGANVLFLTVDLCSLCGRLDDPSLAMFVSAALFGDGASGVVLRSSHDRSHRAGEGKPLGTISAVGEHCWRDTERIMGWDIKENGFGVVLSPELPQLMRERLGPALTGFLDQHAVSLEDFSGYLFHPGGRKVLETVEQVLGIERPMIRHSWDILREYGNMSSATALFVLERALVSGASGRHLLAAFGPGFSAYFIVLDL